MERTDPYKLPSDCHMCAVTPLAPTLSSHTVSYSLSTYIEATLSLHIHTLRSDPHTGINTQKHNLTILYSYTMHSNYYTHAHKLHTKTHIFMTLKMYIWYKKGTLHTTEREKQSPILSSYEHCDLQ